MRAFGTRSRHGRRRGFARALAATALAAGALLAVGAGSALAGSAGPHDIVIDAFTAGSGSWSTCGNSKFVYYQHPSIIGGARELAMRDGGSCHFGPFPAQMAIDATQGTASWGGPNTYSPEQHFSYGTEIGTQANVPWSPNPNGGKGTPLHLALSLSDEIVIQMVQVNNPFLSIELRDGTGATYQTSLSLTAGTNLVPLSSFPGLTAAAAAEIDGISFSGSNKNPIDVVSLFAIRPGDTTPPAAAPTQSPAANGAGWNSSDVTVNWNWTDTGSGIDASNCTTSSTSTGEGAGMLLTATCSDNAGNVGSATYTVNVDKTAPVVSYSGNAGTYSVDQSVAISCSASDALSGVASSSCAGVSGPAWSFGPGSHTFSASATDNAGNTGSGSTSFTVTVDATSLCALVQQFSTKAGIANSLCAKLNAAAAAAARGQANAKANIIGAFDNEVAAQSGKALTAAQATLLTQLAAAL